MKKKHLSIPFFLAVLSLIFFVACYNQEQDLSEKMDLRSQEDQSSFNTELANSSNRKGVPDNTISLATFNDWTTNWRSHWNDRYISNFTMPLSNLQNIVNTPDVAAARLYLGYSEADGTPHLVLVGVDAECESMIGANDYIYNVTAPCPSSCGNATPVGHVFPPTGLTQQPANTIPLATFNAWNTSWESHWDDNYIECFTSSLSNLQNIVNTNGVASVRFYLGYSEEDGQAHMSLVGVDANGYTMVGQNTFIYNRLHMSPPRMPSETCEGLF